MLLTGMENSYCTILQIKPSASPGNLLFEAYDSPFSLYPLLRSRSRVLTDLASISSGIGPSSSDCSASSVSISTSYCIPDLRPLKVAAAVREAKGDQIRCICQYEIPGGGTCRDSDCEDIHLKDMEPTGEYFLRDLHWYAHSLGGIYRFLCTYRHTDDETAKYLLEAMSNELGKFDEAEIVHQLVQVRGKVDVKLIRGGQVELSFEERVAEAIASLLGRHAN